MMALALPQARQGCTQQPRQRLRGARQLSVVESFRQYLIVQRELETNHGEGTVVLALTYTLCNILMQYLAISIGDIEYMGEYPGAIG
jgi:hypothetical protein